MKQFAAYVVLLGGVLVACNNPQPKVVGKWKVVLPEQKMAQIEAVYKQNEAEILATEKVTPGLADEYGTLDLEVLKERMLAELKSQYESALIKPYHYEFTKDGYVVLFNEKNGSEDTLFAYTQEGNEINLVLVDPSKAFSESVFEEGSNLNVLKATKDSLILTLSAGTFVDTTYLTRVQHK